MCFSQEMPNEALLLRSSMGNFSASQRIQTPSHLRGSRMPCEVRL